MQGNFIETAKANPATFTGAVVYLVAEGGKLGVAAASADKASGGALKKALAGSKKFTAKRGQYLLLAAPSGVKASQLVLAGIGNPAELTAHAAEQVGGGLVPYLNAAEAVEALVVLEDIKGATLATPELAARLLHGAKLRSWRFDKYRTDEKPEAKPTLATFNVALTGAKAAAQAYAPLEKLEDGIFLTRTLVTEPPNIIYPASLAEQCKTLAKLGVTVEVLGEEEMYRLSMGALLGVGQGSARESQLVVMRWNGLGARSKSGPVAFVGKGVTFDTGGISIKPAAGMDEMKWDMGGAGTVIGLMKTLAGRKARVNAVGIVGLVENMPGGNAQRPGDVVKSMSGQTIEVLNTDAEGRLVLADALWYCQDRFKPRFMVDLATLTGAIIVSLGTSRAGLFSNDDALSQQLFEVGAEVGEPVWRLPLGDEYDKQINSPIADMQNIGKDREAGSITAAQFLQRFVNKLPWAHLDIAGTAWSKADSELTPKGSTAFGVRLLNRLVEKYYEE